MGSFATSELAYQFVEKYLHTYFTRQYLCPRTSDNKSEYEDRIRNVVLGQFEDMVYIRKTTP
jgi:hypothetical protein